MFVPAYNHKHSLLFSITHSFSPMARVLPILKPHFLPSLFAFLIVVAVVLSVFSVVTFLCGKEQKAVSMSCKKSKALRLKAKMMVKMVLCKRVQDEGETDDDEDEAIWKKRIIKGEKCGPLDFSGSILYDSDGKLLLE
ncbi:hypothetical protein SASPL_146803 [Salvia splendens]|uniref:Uncharacterized protein n=1 Tax=Salvia splendens TaxID=180675 RepID=A0A8X8Z649_SALSN|nr:hypothetical protein SASPL_146803 [Salvia splendens]